MQQKQINTIRKPTNIQQNNLYKLGITCKRGPVTLFPKCNFQVLARAF